jgi:hypothetical protein
VWNIGHRAELGITVVAPVRPIGQEDLHWTLNTLRSAEAAEKDEERQRSFESIVLALLLLQRVQRSLRLQRPTVTVLAQWLGR